MTDKKNPLRLRQVLSGCLFPTGPLSFWVRLRVPFRVYLLPIFNRSCNHQRSLSWLRARHLPYLPLPFLKSPRLRSTSPVGRICRKTPRCRLSRPSAPLEGVGSPVQTQTTIGV